MAIVATSGEEIMTTGYDTAGFAIKIGYYVVAAAMVVFAAMLMLTLYP